MNRGKLHLNSDAATIQWRINDPPGPEKRRLLIVFSEGIDRLGNHEFIASSPVRNSIFLEEVPPNSYEFGPFYHQIIFKKNRYFEVVVLIASETTENSVTGLVV